jgi:N-dimethylarginine dimethylaminohydrolase
MMRALLMVPPDHYAVAYEINPWMSLGRPADPAEAARQWQGLRRLVAAEMGARVHLAEPVPGLPDMVFTANAGLIWGRRAILSRFRHPERQGEAEQFARWFSEHSFSVERLPEGCYFEGEGDALFLGDTLFAGYHFRSDVCAHQWIGECLGVRTLSLQLADPRFYHLDTCFCPLDAETAAWYPPAFDDYARRVLAAEVPRLIEVTEAEAFRFACNAVVLGPHVALNAGCPEFEAQLRDLGFTPHATPLDEFLKAGGSAKCLTLHLDHPGLEGEGEAVAIPRWEVGSASAARGTRRGDS